LSAQYRLALTNIAFSAAYIAAAFVCIAIGLWRRSAATRRFALALSVIAIAKLFLIDSFKLTLGYRVAGYFIFGIVLIGMSLLYQVFYKKFAAPPEPSATETSAADADNKPML
jgi:uncharacterized membrane protein